MMINNQIKCKNAHDDSLTTNPKQFRAESVVGIYLGLPHTLLLALACAGVVVEGPAAQLQLSHASVVPPLNLERERS